jgi:UPF0755 protein
VSRNRNLIIAIIFLLVFMMGLCGGLILLVAGDDILEFTRTAAIRIRLSNQQELLETPLNADDSVVRFTVQPGATARTIGAQLEANGIISDGRLFADYAQVEELDQDLEAGTFFISSNMSISEIAEALTTASFSQIRFTVLPGQRIEEIAENIDAMTPYFTFTGADFLAVVGRGAPIPPEFARVNGIPTGSSLEGFLMPETYILEPEVTALELRDMLLTQYSNSITPTMRQIAADDGYTMYQMVTLASIIEREAVYNDENARISSVYRNRLEIEDDLRTLDADPTVQYQHPNAGLGNWWPSITVADYRGVNSPYNTYINAGLPPGPIANPAISAIQAAIRPETTPYLFFRADCRGDLRHDFFTNYNDHANAC